MSTASLPLSTQTSMYKVASTDLAPLGPPIATGLGPDDGGTLISPFPPPTPASASAHAHAHTHAPTKLPPHYDTIPRSSKTSQYNPPFETPVSAASGQSIQNQEKQALRDAWAKQDLAHPAEVDHRQVSPQRTSSSAQPSSSASYSPSAQSGHRPTSSNTSPTKSARQSAVSGPSELGRRGSLPPGMDIQEALARCEDPTLGWSLTFWVTIADPVTQHVFFACPASGQCSWDPPVGAFVVPRSPDGEWWELADATRKNRSYCYNTLTGKTQWTRPSDAFVIPLGLIQRNALPSRPHQRSAHSAPSHLTPSRGDSGSTTVSPATPQTPRSGPRPPPSPRVTPGRQGSSHSDTLTQSPSLLTPNLSFGDIIALGPGSDPALGTADKRAGPEADIFRQPVLPRTPLSIVEEDAGNETDLSDTSGPGGGWWEKRRSKMSGFKASPKKSSKPRMLSVTAEERSEPSISSGQLQVTLPSSNGSVQRGSELPKDRPSSPIFVDAVKTKRMSTGLHPLLPSAISTEIKNFQADDFASKYFATKRSGMLRARVTLERIMVWQKQPISQPLLVLSKTLAKDATTTFRVIQHAMGERDRPVDNARITSTVQRDVRAPNRSRHSMEKAVVLEEVRWMLHVGVTAGEMRDEIYSQLIKQLTKNPDHDATVLGFQLFCVLVNSFAPSKNFEVFVRNFLRKEIIGSDGISVMCRYCMTKLEIMIERGGRGRLLTVGEIEHASDAAFYPTVYGEKLERIMELQEQSYPGSQIPIVLTFLTNGILALGGLASEGIFRVPGDGDLVAELKSRIDRGHYRLEDMDDPHVAASLFKQWLRELAVPLIPEDLYNAALSASKSTPDTLAFVARLPGIHRRVLVHVISFIQLFLDAQVIAETKMTPQNLALVLAPNILRTTSNHLETVFTNASFESSFVLRLLEHLEPDKVDPDFVPVHGVSAT